MYGIVRKKTIYERVIHARDKNKKRKSEFGRGTAILYEEDKESFTEKVTLNKDQNELRKDVTHLEMERTFQAVGKASIKA